MRRSSRVVLAALCIGSLVPTVPSVTAHAQLAVICPTCSNVITQTVQLAKEAGSLAQQIAAYQLQIQQYSNMLQNTAMLPTMAWNDAVGDIVRIQSLMNSGMLLAGNAQSFTTTLSNV